MKRKILVYDTGYGCEIAAGLASQFEKVYYYTPWQRPSPEVKSYAAGLGLPGVERVPHFFDVVDSVDLIAFFDLGYGDAAAFLRKKGYTVFGAGHGEKLEIDRWGFRKLQKKLGLEFQATTQVHGTGELREYLKKNPQKYVKVSLFRGSSESFYAETLESSELLIHEVEEAFGPLKDDYDFMCESKINAELETGFDAFFGADWVHPVLWGFEFQKGAYIGRFGDVPKWHQITMKALSGTLQECDYRGPISVEEKVLGKERSIAIDVTARFPFTFSSAYPVWITNLGEVMWQVAKKLPVTIKPVGKFVGCLPLESPHVKDHWMKLDFDESLRTKGVKNGCVRLAMGLRTEKGYFAVPGMPVVYNLVAWGNTVEEVSGVLESLVERVSAADLVKDTSGLGKILKYKKQLGW